MTSALAVMNGEDDDGEASERRDPAVHAIGTLTLVNSYLCDAVECTLRDQAGDAS